MTIPSQAIIDTILADVNAVIPNFASVVTSYRLLVGAAEEIHRSPGVPVDIYQRAIERFDRAGSIIDILLELLCCKISFSSDFLAVTCAPVDLFRLLANRCEASDTPRHTAEQVLQLEVLRRALEKTCLGPPDSAFNCPTPQYVPPPPTPPGTPSGPSDLGGGGSEIAITVPVTAVPGTTTTTTTRPPSDVSPDPTIQADEAKNAGEQSMTPPPSTPSRPLKRRHI